MSSTTGTEHTEEMSMSWMDWMGVNSSAASHAPVPATNEGGAPAFKPEEARELYREVFQALQVPRRLSGPRRIRRGTFEIASEVFPAQFFSGDFVAVFDSGNATFLALGDIAGKGLTAAMWSTHVLGLIRTYSVALGLPHAVLQAVNRDLYALGSAPLTTMVLARLDWRHNQLTYSNAGHVPPVLHRSNGTVEQLTTGGPVLAAISDAPFECSRVPFAAGDMLVSCTDGLIECRNDNDEEFGTEQLIHHIRRAASLGASRALFSIVGAAQDFAGGRPRIDDLTLMVVSG